MFGGAPAQHKSSSTRLVFAALLGCLRGWVVLRFAALLSRRQRTGMPLFIVGVHIAEPSTASRTANRGGMRAWLVVTRYGLTEMLQVRA